jgi:hypothetical protein
MPGDYVSYPLRVERKGRKLKFYEAEFILCDAN